MRRILFLLVTGLLTVSPLYAQKRAFSIEDLYRIKSLPDVSVSPDGKTVLYTVSTPDLPRGKRVNHVWLMNTDGTNARQLIQDDKGEYSPSFSPDGKWIAVISSRDGDAVSDLTPGNFDSPSFQLGGPLQYDFSPDGTEFVYVSNHDKHPESSTNNDLWIISLKDRNA